MQLVNTESTEVDSTMGEQLAPQRPVGTKRIDLRERPEFLLVPILFIVVILAWEFLLDVFSIPTYVLPKPSQIASSFWGIIQKPEFWVNFGVTAQEALWGFLIGVTLALLVGAVVAQFRLVERTLMPYIVAFQTMPKIALAPLFIIWFGFGMTSKIVMAAVICFFPMLINVIAGLRAADPERIEMLTVFGASRFQVFRMVRFPSALPFIFAGLNIGIVFSILGAIVGEFVGSKEGLGYQLLHANFNFDIPLMFAILLSLSAMGLIADFIIKFIRRKVVFWGEESQVLGA